MSFIRTFEPNFAGNDYVIGDLHGMYDVLCTMLNGLNFNKEKDRLFSVGDIIDRGDKNIECLRLLREPWFFSVRGNHEDMMVQSLTCTGPQGMYWLRNGGAPWGATASLLAKDIYKSKNNPEHKIPDYEEIHHEIMSYVPDLEKLPYLITVKTRAGLKKHIIHAELISSEHITDADLEDEEIVQYLGTKQTVDGHAFLWGRYLFYNFHGKDLSDKKVQKSVKSIKQLKSFGDELSHIISGHTILTAPLTIHNRTNIDTGAFKTDDSKFRGKLTCIDINEWKFYQSTSTEFNSVQPFELNIINGDIKND